MIANAVDRHELIKLLDSYLKAVGDRDRYGMAKYAGAITTTFQYHAAAKPTASVQGGPF